MVLRIVVQDGLPFQSLLAALLEILIWEWKKGCVIQLAWGRKTVETTQSFMERDRIVELDIRALAMFAQP
jgi:hypothetical protein